MRGNRGFTLVEVLVTFVVAGILIASSVPGFMKSMRVHRDAQGREQLVQHIRGARQLAITKHCPVIVRFGNGTNTSNIASYVIHEDTNNDRIVQSTERQMVRNLPQGVLLSQVQLSPTDSLVFDISGTLWPGTDGGRLVLATRGAPDTLMVTAVGMVYVP